MVALSSPEGRSLQKVPAEVKDGFAARKLLLVTVP
jgi:hypothetical protein